MPDTTLEWMGEGASLGTAIMPGIGTGIGAALGGLASLATSIFPGLTPHLGGPQAASVVASLAPAFEAVLGTSDPQTASAALASDPSLGPQLRVQLAQIAADAEKTRNEALTASFADTADARQRQVKLNDWTTPALAFLIAFGFFGMMMVFAFVDIPQSNAAAFNILIGALGASFATVVGYFFGSSAGSARKDLKAGN